MRYINSLYQYDSNIIWENTLPVIDIPFFGESLLGFLLRLDYINGFFPGTILKQSIPEEKSFLLNCHDRNEELEENINISYISSLLNIHEEYIANIKISNIRKKIFGNDSSAAKELIKLGPLKICPLCVQEWHLPLIFFIEGVNTCIVHGKRLLQNCLCDRRIEIFNKTNPFICRRKSCNRNYLCIDNSQDNSTIKSEAYNQSIVSNLFFSQYKLLKEGFINIECFNSKIQFISNMRNKAKEYIREYFNLYISFMEYNSYSEEPISDKTDIVSIIKKLDRISITFFEFVKLPSPSSENMTVNITELYVDDSRSLLNKSDWDESDWWILQLSNELSDRIRFKKAFNSSHLIHEILASNRPICGKVEVKSDWLTVCFNFRVLYELKRKYIIEI